MIHKIICWIFGHDYFLVKRLTPQSRKIGCHRCHKMFAMNDDVRCIVDWTDEFEHFYEDYYKITGKVNHD